MLYGIYSIHDIKAVVFNPPFFAINDAVAKRIVSDSLDGNSSLSRHPADYKVYLVGEFNDQTGAIREIHPPLYVVDVISLVGPPPVAADLFPQAAQ